MKKIFVTQPLAAACAAFLIAAVSPRDAAASLPAPWLQTDIGAAGVAGSGSYASGVFTVGGSGADIWGSADAFHFTYQRLNGNTQIIAKVASVQNTGAWAKAGLMIREDLTAESRNAFALVSAASGASFQSRATPAGTTSSTVATGIAAPYWLKLCRSGDLFTAFRSPDGLAWTLIGSTRVVGMQPVVYAGLAVTSHNNAAKCTAAFASVQFLAPPLLLVVGSTSLNAGDAAAKKRLEALGYAVTIKAAASAVTADANGKDLVVISSTVNSGDVNTKFTNVAVPVITWEPNALHYLGMTGSTNGTDYGTVTNQTDAVIAAGACDFTKMYTAATNFADGCHDMTAGLYGSVPVLRTAGTAAWGKPGAGAVTIAYQSATSGRALEFAYDKGAAMPGLAAAPARRVFLFLTDNSASTWTLKGQTLFDQAVYWATNTRYYVVKKILHLNFDPVMHTQNDVREHVWGSGAYSWLWFGDPILLLRTELAALTEASGGYVRWKFVKYSAIPDYLDSWVPIVSTDGNYTPQFNSADFTEQDFINGYDQGPTLGHWAEAGQAMPNHGNYMADYNKIFDTYGVDAKINNGEIDEVVMSTGPLQGVAESGMAGRAAYAINGPTVFRNTPNFVFMGQSYERRVGEALENFGHRSEWFMAFHVYRNSSDETLPYNCSYWPDGCAPQLPAPQRDLWDRFSVVDGNSPGNAGVGAAHWAPNIQSFADQYRWNLTNYAYTMADDWAFNYPNLVGAATKRLVNVDEWMPMDPSQTPDGGIGFKKWWYHHMPRIPGHYKDAANAANNGKLNNWWEYIVNYNRHPETQN